MTTNHNVDSNRNREIHFIRMLSAVHTARQNTQNVH